MLVKLEAVRAAQRLGRSAELCARVSVAAREDYGGGYREHCNKAVCVTNRAAEPQALAEIRRSVLDVSAAEGDDRQVRRAERCPVDVADGAVAFKRLREQRCRPLRG
jgi:hypothetical protein